MQVQGISSVHTQNVHLIAVEPTTVSFSFDIVGDASLRICVQAWIRPAEYVAGLFRLQFPILHRRC
jgi:hypothetical protein